MENRAEKIASSKKIAVVGVSKRKFGGGIYKELKKRGYNVYPVHRTMENFDGDQCYDSLKSVPEDVDAAVISVSPASAESVVDDALERGINKLWFQQGPDFTKMVEKAEAAGIETVSRKCILMYAQPVTGIHAFHRFLAKLFNKV
jgi:predicted CoA-binding protein